MSKRTIPYLVPSSTLADLKAHVLQCYRRRYMLKPQEKREYLRLLSIVQHEDPGFDVEKVARIEFAFGGNVSGAARPAACNDTADCEVCGGPAFLDIRTGLYICEYCIERDNREADEE